MIPMDKYDEHGNWKRKLQEKLEIPFIVKVSEGPDGWAIKYGNELKVIKISSVDDLYVVIADFKH